MTNRRFDYVAKNVTKCNKYLSGTQVLKIRIVSIETSHNDNNSYTSLIVGTFQMIKQYDFETLIILLLKMSVCILWN